MSKLLIDDDTARSSVAAAGTVISVSFSVAMGLLSANPVGIPMPKMKIIAETINALFIEFPPVVVLVLVVRLCPVRVRLAVLRPVDTV